MMRRPGQLAALVALSWALTGPATATAVAPGAAHHRSQQPAQTTTRYEGWTGTEAELDEALERWPKEFVSYLITDQELQLYQSLEDREQRLRFIDRFWELRDPTPGTQRNEYREEHLRRFAFATRMYAAGKPGWATDRGRIYIILGPPNQLQRNPTGRGPMERASEVWTYNGVDNPRLDASLDLAFVDFHGTGEYELVTDIDATAPIWSEQSGYVNSNLDAYALRRHADTLYNERLGTSRRVDPARLAQDYLDFSRELREIERVPEIHLARLRSLRRSVEATVSFDAFPVDSVVSYFQATGGATAVEVTVALSYDELLSTYVGGQRHYSADLYAALQRQGEVVDDDERRLNFSLAPQEWDRLEAQKILQPLRLSAPAGSYELLVMVRDNPTEKVGRSIRQIELPALDGPGLRLSSLTLASRVARATRHDDHQDRPFVKGDLRVVPNVGASYRPRQPLLLYVQAYGLQLNAASGTNKVTVGGRIERDGARFRELPAQHPYPAPKDRMAFSLQVPLKEFPPGAYSVTLTVVDEVAGTSASVSAPFQVASAREMSR
ncbi:MAG: GWxTD domain-containing protein [Acidobacteriota bacterium]